LLPLPLPLRRELPAPVVGHVVKSPMVGTFYRASSPAPSPLWMWVPGQGRRHLCIIEAMKILNEIEADKTGTMFAFWVKTARLWNTASLCS
jgi:acetyl-CoA carboxylase biotin carboxyl carrier protein